MGQIAAAAGAKRHIESPLTVEIEMFVKRTAFIATFTGVVFFILSYFLVDNDFLDQFVFLIGEGRGRSGATRKGGFRESGSRGRSGGGLGGGTEMERERELRAGTQEEEIYIHVTCQHTAGGKQTHRQPHARSRDGRKQRLAGCICIPGATPSRPSFPADSPSFLSLHINTPRLGFPTLHSAPAPAALWYTAVPAALFLERSCVRAEGGSARAVRWSVRPRTPGSHPCLSHDASSEIMYLSPLCTGAGLAVSLPGIFVAFVPQGLPATVTMLLTFAAMRLKDRNVLVKDLTAVGWSSLFFFFFLWRGAGGVSSHRSIRDMAMLPMVRAICFFCSRRLGLHKQAVSAKIDRGWCCTVEMILAKRGAGRARPCTMHILYTSRRNFPVSPIVVQIPSSFPPLSQLSSRPASWLLLFLRSFCIVTGWCISHHLLSISPGACKRKPFLHATQKQSPSLSCFRPVLCHLHKKKLNSPSSCSVLVVPRPCCRAHLVPPVWHDMARKKKKKIGTQKVDTLGTITLLASDKTGTLTMNRMTVVDVWMNGKQLSAPGGRGAEPDPEASFGSTAREVRYFFVYCVSRCFLPCLDLPCREMRAGAAG